MASSKINSHLYALIMAGGRGTRFWPESTSKKPKQYLNLTGKKSLLAETLSRFDELVGMDKRYIVTTLEQEKLAKNCSKGKIGNSNYIFEPLAKNTAPCILLSIAKLVSEGAKDNDAVIVVPSDHVILNTEGFRSTLKEASEISLKEDKVITIGITPTFPHTGFGYIQKGEQLSDCAFDVEEFKEKPDFETAKDYVASGNYYWNAGMFVGTINIFLSEFELHDKESFQYFSRLVDAYKNDDKDELAEIYNKLPANSIDYAIMEKSKNIGVLPARFDWNDLGSWDALEAVLGQKDKNTVVASKHHYFDGAKGNIVFTPNKFVSLINVNDLIVVVNDEAVMILPKKDSQKVKEIVSHLKESKWGEKLL